MLIFPYDDRRSCTKRTRWKLFRASSMAWDGNIWRLRKVHARTPFTTVSRFKINIRGYILPRFRFYFFFRKVGAVGRSNYYALPGLLRHNSSSSHSWTAKTLIYRAFTEESTGQFPVPFLPFLPVFVNARMGSTWYRTTWTGNRDVTFLIAYPCSPFSPF